MRRVAVGKAKSRQPLPDVSTRRVDPPPPGCRKKLYVTNKAVNCRSFAVSDHLPVASLPSASRRSMTSREAHLTSKQETCPTFLSSISPFIWFRLGGKRVAWVLNMENAQVIRVSWRAWDLKTGNQVGSKGLRHRKHQVNTQRFKPLQDCFSSYVGVELLRLTSYKILLKLFCIAIRV